MPKIILSLQANKIHRIDRIKNRIYRINSEFRNPVNPEKSC
jgi:hypothetical protein